MLCNQRFPTLSVDHSNNFDFDAFSGGINPSLAEHDMPCLSKQCRSRSVKKPTDLELFCLSYEYVNFCQKHGSSNLIGWKLEVGVAS